MFQRLAPALGTCTTVSAFTGAVLVGLAGAGTLLSPGVLHAATRQTASATAEAHSATLTRYCVTCHNERLKTAGLVLDPSALSRVGEAAEVWEKVVSKLQTGAMPPPSAARPDGPVLDGLRTWLEAELDATARAHPDPGRTSTFHRLNRAEYRNAVRDLLTLDIDVATLLPADDIDEQGFDNMADVLTVSPVLLERYLSAARKIARLAVGRPPLAPSTDAYKAALLLVQDDRMSDELPFGSRGGLAVRHHFPVDGEYEITVRLQRNYVNYIRGLGTRQHLDIRLDGVRLKRFSIGGENKGRPAPASYAGNIFGDPAWEQWALYADSDLTLRLKVAAGPHTLGVSFARGLTAEEGVLQPRQSVFAEAINDKRDGYAAIEEVTVGGPLTVDGPGDTPSRRTLFVCRPTRAPEEAACARRILEKLARRAYRRPVQASDVDTLLSFYTAGRMEGGFDAGIQSA
ncbi:MAG: DUF1587 domain-containing protein, partial [Vicinamibacterales bacterium]